MISPSSSNLLVFSRYAAATPRTIEKHSSETKENTNRHTGVIIAPYLKKNGGFGGDDSDFSADAVKQILIAGKASQAGQKSGDDLLSAWDDFFEARDARYRETKNNLSADIDAKEGETTTAASPQVYALAAAQGLN
ncbi:MAG: hypothetical protein LBQ56_04620 [Synergistaceae bacterium]|jgi:hypothetical protein|nr:hypothetical protein [Synergistaceae bacterium]